MSINELRDYAEKMSNLLEHTEAIRLLWVTDILLDHLSET